MFERAVCCDVKISLSLCQISTLSTLTTRTSKTLNGNEMISNMCAYMIPTAGYRSSSIQYVFCHICLCN